MGISVFLFLPLAPSSLIERSLASDFGFPLSDIFIHSWDFLNLLLFGLSSVVSPSVAFVMKDVPVPQSYFMISCWPCSNLSMSFLLERPELVTEPWWSLTSSERKNHPPGVRIVVSEHRVLLALSITGAPPLLVFSLLPIKNTRAFSEPSNWLAPAHVCAVSWVQNFVLVSVHLCESHHDILLIHTSHSCQIKAKRLWFICDESHGPSRICFPTQGQSWCVWLLVFVLFLFLFCFVLIKSRLWALVANLLIS